MALDYRPGRCADLIGRENLTVQHPVLHPMGRVSIYCLKRPPNSGWMEVLHRLLLYRFAIDMQHAIDHLDRIAR